MSSSSHIYTKVSSKLLNPTHTATQKELLKSWPPSSEIQWIPTSPAAPSSPASPAFLLALLLPAQIRSYIFLFFSCKRSSLRHHILCHSKNFHLARRHSIHLFISLVLIQPSPALAEEIEVSRNHSSISLLTSILNQISSKRNRQHRMEMETMQ